MSIEAGPADFELVREGNLWVPTHVETGVASQGSTPSEAVEMAEEAAELFQREHRFGDEDHHHRMLEASRIDPQDVSDSVETPEMP